MGPTASQISNDVIRSMASHRRILAPLAHVSAAAAVFFLLMASNWHAANGFYQDDGTPLRKDTDPPHPSPPRPDYPIDRLAHIFSYVYSEGE